MVEEWQEKCDSQAGTASWLLENTKRCPQCKVRIEKNQGCNHIICHQCKHEFCWICLGSWVDHSQQTGGFYKCNRYDAKKGGNDAGGAGRSEEEQEIDRFLFYYQRFLNHDRAGKFAERLRSNTRAKMEELQKAAAARGANWTEVAFLESASETVIRCRQVLSNTYVLGFFMEDSPDKDLLEHLQEQLERATEHLAELTEQDLSRLDRQALVNYSEVTSKFLNGLLDGLEEGLTAGAYRVVRRVPKPKPKEKDAAKDKKAQPKRRGGMLGSGAHRQVSNARTTANRRSTIRRAGGGGGGGGSGAPAGRLTATGQKGRTSSGVRRTGFRTGASAGRR